MRSKKGENKDQRGGPVGSASWSRRLIIVVSFILACWSFEIYCNYWLPHEALRHERSSGQFHVGSAKAYLQQLTALGPRLTGSHTTEVLAPALIKQWITDIISRNKDALTAQIEVDEKRSASHFYIGFLGGIMNVYKNVNNVAVRLSWPSNISEASSTTSATRDQEAILVNAHYDSVPGSPGAADDGIGIASMVEVIRLIATGPPLSRPVIMLFNGAEEWNHQAAHGFITQHRWGPSIKYLINLESIGSGGKEMMFQCNSGLMAKLYGRLTPFPHGQVVAHELFKYFLWKAASTDWSTFLKYGSPGMKGIDTAYIENGYVYHTSSDTTGVIPTFPCLQWSDNYGTFIHTGENLLQLVRGLSQAEIAGSLDADPDANADQYAVFFDFLGFAFITYSGIQVTAVHCAIFLLGVAAVVLLGQSIAITSATALAQLYVIELKCIGLPIIFGVVYGLFLHFLCPMRWYDGGLPVATALYLLPVATCCLYVRGELFDGRLQRRTEVKISSLLYWMSLLLLGIVFRIMSAYVCALWILFVVTALAIQHVYSRLVFPKIIDKSSFLHSPDFIYLVVIAPLFCSWLQTIDSTFVMVIPLLGKSGTVVPADIIVGALMGSFLGPIGGAILGSESVEKVSRGTLRKVGAISLLIISYFALFSTSYSSTHPKRLWLQHVHRTFRNHRDVNFTEVRDNGMWITGFDGQGLSPLLPSLEKYWHVIQESGSGTSRSSATDLISRSKCNVGNGDCYSQYPWYFPVADVMRDLVFVPLTDKHSLRGQSAETKDNAVSSSSSGRLMSQQPFEMKIELIPQMNRCPPPHPTRVVAIDLFGPSHLNLVIRDNLHRVSQPARFQWDLSHDETSGASNSEDHFETLSPVRGEGVYFLSIGFGACQDRCHKRIRLRIFGSEPLEVVAYAHYVDHERTQEIRDFMQFLPDWAVGAEWTNFPSALIRDFV